MKRQKVNYELIVKQLEALQTSRKPETAAKKLRVNYATFLARFRRSGMPVKEAHNLLRNGVEPKIIAHTIFPDKTIVQSNTLEKRLVADIIELVRETVHQEMQAA